MENTHSNTNNNCQPYCRVGEESNTLNEFRTDISLAVLAAASEAGSFPWSACFQNGNPPLCSKSCDSNLIGRNFRRELYGDNSWVYKDRFSHLSNAFV